MKTVLGIALGLLLLAGMSRPARASGYGYICNSAFYPASANPPYGNHGHIDLYVTSAPNCTGGWIGSFNICSTGATSGNCNSSWLLNEPQLLMTAAELQRASSINQGVYVDGSTYGPVFYYIKFCSQTAC